MDVVNQVIDDLKRAARQRLKIDFDPLIIDPRLTAIGYDEKYS